MNDNNSAIDFLGIGAQKSATTWIHECLVEHPQICIPKTEGRNTKDLNFFARKNNLEEYKGYFSRCSPKSLKGEVSVDYLFNQEIAQKIESHFPEVKIIACLRNPIERAYSQFRHKINRDELDDISFSEALEKEPELVKRGKYYEQIKRYYDLFPEENILVLIYENIEEDPKGFIQEIYDFLGVKKNFVPAKIRTRVNISDFRSTSVGYFIHEKVTPLLKKTGIGASISRNSFVRKVFYKFAELYTNLAKKEKGGVKKSTRRKLEGVFQEDVSNLEQLIGRDLSHWGIN